MTEKKNNGSELPIVESRRAFLGACASAIAGLTVVSCGGILAGCEATTTAPVPPGGGGNQNGGNLTLDVSSLTADGMAFVTSQRGPDGKRIAIARKSENEYVALSMECTHERNEMSPPSGGVISCPFHGSKFDLLTGAVQVGPATSPLRRYETTYDAATKKLTVKLS